MERRSLARCSQSGHRKAENNSISPWNIVGLRAGDVKVVEDERGSRTSGCRCEAALALCSRALSRSDSRASPPVGLRVLLCPTWSDIRCRESRPGRAVCTMGGDLSAPGKLRKRGVRTFSELRRLMSAIDQAATTAGHPPKKVMTHEEANKCFVFGKVGVKVPLATSSGRPRVLARLTWQSALRLAPKASF